MTGRRRTDIRQLAKRLAKRLPVAPPDTPREIEHLLVSRRGLYEQLTGRVRRGWNKQTTEFATAIVDTLKKATILTRRLRRSLAREFIQSRDFGLVSFEAAVVGVVADVVAVRRRAETMLTALDQHIEKTQSVYRHATGIGPGRGRPRDNLLRREVGFWAGYFQLRFSKRFDDMSLQERNAARHFVLDAVAFVAMKDIGDAGIASRAFKAMTQSPGRKLRQSLKKNMRKAALGKSALCNSLW